MKSFYAVLGVDSTSTTEEIKAKYRSLLLSNHPDKLKNNTTNRTIQDIQQAYKVLSTDESRKQYDEQLHKERILSGVLDIESVDRYDLSTFEEMVLDNGDIQFQHDCPRCTTQAGFILTEHGLENALDAQIDTEEDENSHVFIQCSSCSLWLCVMFSVN